jgi:hypothetical protein
MQICLTDQQTVNVIYVHNVTNSMCHIFSYEKNSFLRTEIFTILSGN